MLQHAFKEWAVICKALASGRQAIILRKGGIAEASGTFRLENTRFWLFPTYVHQQAEGIKPEAAALLEEVEAEKPRAGVIRLTHYAEVTGVYQLHDLVGAWRIADFHIWSQETVQKRFVYKNPGLFLLVTRVYRVAQVHELTDVPAYAGCRTWVELEQALSTEGAVPVLQDEAFQEVILRLDRLLKPTTLA